MRSGKKSRRPSRRRGKNSTTLIAWLDDHRRPVAVAAAAVGLLLLLFSLWAMMPFWRLSRQFGSFSQPQPSRVYAQPVTLEVGDRVGSAERLADRLASLGFVEAQGLPPVGGFSRQDAGFDLVAPPVLTETGWRPSAGVTLALSGSRLTAIRVNGKAVQSAPIVSPVISVLTDRDGAERIPVRLEDLPDHVVRAVLAAEDASFFDHSGISPRGILRAATANLRRGGPLQGGSTLTQQLVKNLYLTHERTWARKLREAVLALFIDAGYGKEQILEAYLNEIYWGRSGNVNLAGIGAAAMAYFNKPAADLSVAEAALLAGMIAAPANYMPTVSPERAVARRDWVLGRMRELDWLNEDQVARAAAEPLRVRSAPLAARRAPYFVDRVLAEAADRFGIRDLPTSGYAILSTLEFAAQQAAESAVATLEKGDDDSAEVAMLSIDVESGAIRSYVGGTDYGDSQFDRARLMRRQAGSAFKPVVYTAALASGRITPATLLIDEPLTVQFASQTWSPQNSNEQYHGWVTARRAIEDSLNVPSARLGLDVGLDRVVEFARKMGIEAPLRAYPSLSLGAFEVSPQELLTVYATLAAEGMRPTLHSVVSVRTSEGALEEGLPLAPRERVVSPQVAYLMTSMLRGVMDRGTGRFARSWGLSDALAGKTGTSNDRRDSWFLGYSPRVATGVWVGHDDNSTTGLGGSRAALPIWTEYMKGVRPAGGFRAFRRPAGIESAWIDPLTGLLAAPGCPNAVSEDFLVSDVPRRTCPLHGGRFRRVLDRVLDPRQLPEGVEVVGRRPGERDERVERPEPRKKKRGFWKRVLGIGRDRDDG